MMHVKTWLGLYLLLACTNFCVDEKTREGLNMLTRHFLGENETPLMESPDTQTAVQKMELTNLCKLIIICIFIIFVVVL